MVITGLTRNQLIRKGPWVRIPPLPPTKDADIDTMSVSSFLPEKSLFAGLFRLFLFLDTFQSANCFGAFSFQNGHFRLHSEMKTAGGAKTGAL